MNFWVKKSIVLVLLYSCFFWKGIPCYGEQEKLGEELMEEMDFRQADRVLEELLEEKISFGAIVDRLILGENPFQGQKDLWKSLLWQSVGISKKAFVKILLLVLFAAFFSNLSLVFKNKQLGEMAFYTVYTMIFLILLKSFEIYGQEVYEKISGVSEFMKALLPAYHIAVTAATGPVTGLAFYQIIMLVIYLAEYIMLTVIFPVVRLYLLLELVNYLTEETLLSKMTELLKNGILWSMKTMTGVIAGLQLIQRLLSPALDAWKRTAVGKTVEAIPGVGDLFGGAAQVMIGSAVLIRNCMGAAAVILMLWAALPPVLYLGGGMIFYQFLAAMVQPVTDKRIAGCLYTMGTSLGMLLKMIITLELMFILTIAILASSLS